VDVTPLIKSGTQVIQGYANGGFKVSGQTYEGAVMVTPSGTLAWDAPADVKGLKPEHFQSLIDVSGDVDVVLLGAGVSIAFLAADIKNHIKNNGLSIDVMDTGAACRTYNVLVAEGRRVCALLLPI